MSKNRDDHVLVTGGAGYVGSHACKALIAAGYTPVTFDNLDYGHRRAVRWGPLEIGDLGDRTQLDRVFDRYRPSAVLHFAAYAYVGESVSDPARYYRNNVAGTLTLLESMRAHDVDQLVFSSSCAVYGDVAATPIDEKQARRPVCPYGRSKVICEDMLADFDAAYGMRHVDLRYFNAAGADPDLEIGEDHTPETHLIPLTISAAAGELAELKVFGTDYPTPDGTAVRDYVHVTDLADAHVRALRHLARGGRSRAYNLGRGAGSSVMEIVHAVERVSGRGVPFTSAPRRSGDPPILVADASRVSRELGWSARTVDLDEIVASAWAFYRSRATA
jgi:UDP-arabinose 4-epimerase